jgi:esterase/lipase
MTQKKPIMNMRQWWIIWLILGITLAIIVFIPWNISNLSSHSRPVRSYTEALQRVEIFRAQEPAKMNPVCQLQLMTHKQKVERAIILVHGYTNCPQQFHQLGQRFYDLGYNVLIAPLPHLGLADRMTEAHGQLKAEELATYADETVDIAQGLGEHVAMMGFSAGGTAAAWAAQNRSDIDLAVIICPVFGLKQIPTPLTVAAMNISGLLPDSFEWWDPVLQSKVSPTYAYPRYSKHALVQILRLGYATQGEAQRMQPASKKIAVVLNANDTAVNNVLAVDVVKNWQAHDIHLTTYEFDAYLKLGHDLIDPTQPDQKIDVVYPRLMDLVSQQSR